MIGVLRSALALLFLAGACLLGWLTVSKPVEPGAFTWRMLASGLPPSIEVYEGRAGGPAGEPFRAWYARIDYTDRKLEAQPFLAASPAGRELPSIQARRAQALVAVNGGYFDMESHPAKTYSLVVRDGKVLRENRSLLSRGGRRYFAPRSAFAITRDRHFEMEWAFHAGGKLWKLPQPAPVRLQPGERMPDFAAAPYPARREWKNLADAVGGGPRLVQGGKVHVTFDDEVFYGSGFQNEANYARAALGWTRDKHLILFVVDGRQPEHSVGLTLTQLARVLASLGCVEAMNLDGGGSAAFIVQGRLLNRPSDGRERETTSILGLISPGSASPAGNHEN